VKPLAIKDVAEQTGVGAATLRMWEQRYGFPAPARSPSGYRVYTAGDVAALRRVADFRRQGLSVPAALERARAATAAPMGRPSIFAALADGPVRPQRLRKRTLVALSRAIEEEALARAAGPVVFGAFQQERNYRAVESRWRRLARVADAAVVFGQFPAVRVGRGDEPIEVPIGPGEPLGHEWAVIVDAPGLAACLVGWEVDEAARVFEAVWTTDPAVVRSAALVAAGLAARAVPSAARLRLLLGDRPPPLEAPAPALTALTNRVVGYLDAMG
jgi:DNA-binding transcriptional MerR regulator